MAFHAITGCDVTSYLAGISKKNAWKTYLESSYLLSILGNIPLSENAIANVEECVVRLYKTNDNVKTCDAARYVLFGKTKKTDSLSPCSDTIRQHIKRAHYQTVIWEKAYLPHIDVPTPASSGWSVDDLTYSHLKILVAILTAILVFWQCYICVFSSIASVDPENVNLDSKIMFPSHT